MMHKVGLKVAAVGREYNVPPLITWQEDYSNETIRKEAVLEIFRKRNKILGLQASLIASDDFIC